MLGFQLLQKLCRAELGGQDVHLPLHGPKVAGAQLWQAGQALAQLARPGEILVAQTIPALRSGDLVTSGLRIAREKRPDVVLLDLQLPDGEAFDLLPILRTAPGTPATFIAMPCSPVGKPNRKSARMISQSGFHDTCRKSMTHAPLNSFQMEKIATSPLEIVTPAAEDRTEVHRIIFEELCAGHVLDSSRQRLIAIIEKAKADGADSVILGCTEIMLLVGARDTTVPVFDTTALHARAAVDFALAP